MSPDSSSGISPAIVSSTAAAGTISQIASGLASFRTNSGRALAPVARSRTRSSTALADRSNTTHSWPVFRSRRTMFAPIRPRPIIPICIASPSRQCVVHDLLRFLHDYTEMRFILEALGVNLIDVFSSRWSCREPAASRDDLQPADCGPVPRRAGQPGFDGLTGQGGFLDCIGRQLL